MLDRILEPEVMDTPEEARDYDAMDHSKVNRVFAIDFLSFHASLQGQILDVGTGTAQIPIAICQQTPNLKILGIDLASHMLEIARQNIVKANLSDRITVELINARSMRFVNGFFDGVVSNSIIHHIPEPFACFSEMNRVCRAGGTLFVRDLLRPDDDATLRHLVDTYAGDANAHQRKMFSDSLHAALTLSEVRDFVARLGYPSNDVAQTSDRHWTWSAKNRGP